MFTENIEGEVALRKRVVNQVLHSLNVRIWGQMSGLWAIQVKAAGPVALELTRMAGMEM